MEQSIFPEGYESALNLHDTQIAIKTVKDFFQKHLAQNLNLARVSAPLFVLPESGLNDNLNGVERPVDFGIREQGDKKAEVVHSLAKWKRFALDKYGFSVGEGIYTDMNARHHAPVRSGQDPSPQVRAHPRGKDKAHTRQPLVLSQG